MDHQSFPARRRRLGILTAAVLAIGAALFSGTALGAVPAVGATPSPSPSAPSCTAVMRIVASWQGGYQTEVSVTAGAAPISRWEVDIPGDVVVYYVYGGTFEGRTVSSWGPLEAGGTTYFGFSGGGYVSTPPPLPCRADA